MAVVLARLEGVMLARLVATVILAMFVGLVLLRLVETVVLAKLLESLTLFVSTLVELVEMPAVPISITLTLVGKMFAMLTLVVVVKKL